MLSLGSAENFMDMNPENLMTNSSQKPNVGETSYSMERRPAGLQAGRKDNWLKRLRTPLLESTAPPLCSPNSGRRKGRCFREICCVWVSALQLR